jgi:hypothetical protein
MFKVTSLRSTVSTLLLLQMSRVWLGLLVVDPGKMNSFAGEIGSLGIFCSLLSSDT